MDYKESFNMLKNKYIEYPMEITIETTGKCNAKCNFCPHSELERRYSDMSNALFLKIISDLKEIPSTHKFSISPFKVNEPLMDRSFFEKLEVINVELPHVGIRFFSNFNMATYEDVEKLSKVYNLEQIWISLNEINPEEYNRVMGLNLDKTLENIKMLLKFNRKHKMVNKVVISRVKDGTVKDNEFVTVLNNMLSGYSDEYELVLIKRVEWIDHLGKQNNIPENEPCFRWFEINITCTGEVALCCMDGKCDYSIGNVNEQSVLEIYNKREYKELRQNGYPRKFIEPCKRCSL